MTQMTMAMAALFMERHALQRKVARREERIHFLQTQRKAYVDRLFDVERLIRIEKELVK